MSSRPERRCVVPDCSQDGRRGFLRPSLCARSLQSVVLILLHRIWICSWPKSVCFHFLPSATFANFPDIPRKFKFWAFLETKKCSLEICFCVCVCLSVYSTTKRKPNFQLKSIIQKYHYNESFNSAKRFL